MSFLFRIFQKNEEDDESVLSALAQDIQKRQTKLDEIRLRERRTTLSASLYMVSLWFLYAAAWYSGIMGQTFRNKTEKAIRALPVVIGPIIVLFIRRIVQLWFNRKGNAEEKTLRELRKKQHNKVEEIKKKTNYYSTRDLLQKYEQGSPSNSPLRTPQRAGPMPNGNRPGPSSAQQTPLSRPSPSQPPPNITLSPPVAIQPRKQWYDKLADAVLGDDGGDSDVARYALICEKCFAHNGLVKESVWEETQYVCPKCQHFNPSKRAKKQTSLSPTSPTALAFSPTPISPQRSSRTVTENRSVAGEPEAQQSNVMMEVDS